MVLFDKKKEKEQISLSIEEKNWEKGFQLVDKWIKKIMIAYSAKRFGSPVAAPSPPEETTSAFASAKFFFCSVKLGGSQFLGTSFIRYNSLLNFLVVSTNAKYLPRANNPVMKGVNNVEYVSGTETHLPFFRLFVMEVSSADN